MASIALGIAGLVGAGSSLASGILGSNAAETASAEQQQEEQAALQEQEQIFGEEQQNIAPFLTAGQTSIASLMKQIQGGTFGAGSLPAVPTFTAPTLEQAQNQPGYQFSLAQGEKGLAEGSAAAGGAVSGGTLQAADQYAQNLGETDYTNVFNQALQTYASQLQSYQAGQSAQNQEFNQALAPATLGAGAAASLNSTSQGAATNISQLMQSLGASQAAGTVGSTNAITGALGGATGQLSQAALLNLILNQSSPGQVSNVPTGTPSAIEGQLGALANPYAPISVGQGPG